MLKSTFSINLCNIFHNNFMVKNKAIEVLKTLTNNDYKQLEDFINSPFHNKNKNLTKMFYGLKKFHPNYDNPQLTKEHLHKIVYSNSKYDFRRVDNRLSDLFILLKKFVHVSQTITDESKINVSFSKKISKTKKYIIAEQLLKKNIKESKHKLGKNNFYESFILNNALDDIYLINDDVPNHLKYSGISYEYYAASVISKMSYYFIALKNLEFNFNADYKNNILNVLMNNINWEAVKTHLDENNTEHNLVQIFICLYKLGCNFKDEESFEFAERLLDKKAHLIEKEDLIDIYWMLYGVCGRLQEVNFKKYTPKLFEIHKFMINNDIHIDTETNQMHPYFYRSCVLTALENNDTEWAKKFVTEYKDLMDTQYRDNMFNYCSALVCFDENNFQSALMYSGKVKYDFFQFKYDLKLIEMKCSYELNNYEQSEYAADSFLKFLNNNKSVSEDKKEKHKNFTVFFKKLWQIKYGERHDETAQLKNEILRTEKLRHKDWLLKKICEIEKATL